MLTCWYPLQKIINLALVAFHAMMSTFTAAAIQSAFIPIAADLDVSLQRASYLTSLFIAILGGAPLFWRPLSDHYGRRPTFLLSLICSIVGNIGCTKEPFLRLDGCMPCYYGIFHQPGGCHRPRSCRREFLQERSGSLHGHLGTDGHSRGSFGVFYIRFCCKRCRVSVDLLDPGNGMRTRPLRSHYS
jgi:Major Facilitator Superfamily